MHKKPQRNLKTTSLSPNQSSLKKGSESIPFSGTSGHPSMEYVNGALKSGVLKIDLITLCKVAP